MAEAQIPIDKGMLVTGHKDVKSYNQYNANSVKVQMDTCQRIIPGDGNKYTEVLSQEVKKSTLKKVNTLLKFVVHFTSNYVLQFLLFIFTLLYSILLCSDVFIF